MTTTTTPRPSRTRLLLQPAIIRAYKTAGIAALGLILVGLVVFLTVNVFYFFNDNWVKPQILGPNHEKVIAAVATEADAQLHRTQLIHQRGAAVAELAQIDRQVATDTRFVADAGAHAGPIASADEAVIRDLIERKVLANAGAADRKLGLEHQIADLDTRLAEQDEMLARLARSPYLRAASGRVVVGFVPYDNLDNVHPGVTLYGCEWGLIRCAAVGKVTALVDGEVRDTHPHDDSPQRGLLVEISLTDAGAAQWGILFAGKKPFWIL
jgi:hypothetical protein